MTAQITDTAFLDRQAMIASIPSRVDDAPDRCFCGLSLDENGACEVHGSDLHEAAREERADSIRDNYDL